MPPARAQVPDARSPTKLSLTLPIVLAVLAGGWLWFDSDVEEEGGFVARSAGGSKEVVLNPELADLREQARARAGPPERTSVAATPLSDDPALIQQAASEESAWAHLELTVLDRVTGAPVPGVFPTFERVVALGAGKPPFSLTRGGVYETDLNGRVAVELQPGVALAYEVRFVGPDSLLSAGLLEPFDPQEERALEVRVDSTLVPQFFVRVVDHVTDEVLLGARIVEVDRFGQKPHMEGPLAFETWRDSRPLAVVGSDGIAAVPRGRWAMKRYAALADGYAPGVFEGARSATRRQHAESIGLLRGAALEVFVSDGSGHPVSAATVGFETKFPELQPPDAAQKMSQSLGTHSVSQATDSAGKVSFSRLPATSAYELYIASSVTGGLGVPVDFVRKDLEPGQTTRVDVVVRPLGTLMGRAFDQSGAPASHTDLVLRRDRGDEGLLMGPFAVTDDRRLTTDQDGAFAFEQVPAGAWLLGPPGIQVEAMESAEEALPAGRYAPTLAKISLEGEPRTPNFRLELDRGHWIRGAVLDGSDQPVDHAFVRGRLGEQDFFWGNTVRSGHFRLGPLPATQIELTVEHSEHGTCPPIQVLPGGDPIELRLAPGGTLSLRTIEASTSLEVSCQFDFSRHDAGGEILEKVRLVNHRGTLDDWGLTPGSWSVLAAGPNDLMAFVGGITIEAGVGHDSIELELAPAGELVLRRAPSTNVRAFDVELRRDGFVFGKHTVPAGESPNIPVPAGPVDARVVGGGSERHLVHVPAGGEAVVLVDAPEDE